MPGPLSARQVCHGVGGAPAGPVLLLPGCLPAGDRVDAPGCVWGCRAGLPAGLGAGSICGCAVPGGCSGQVPSAPIFAGLGTAPLPAGNARGPWVTVAVWCCGWCRCAARMDARSCLGALWRAGPRWCWSVCSPRGVGGVLSVWCGDGCVVSGVRSAGGPGGHWALRCADA